MAVLIEAKGSKRDGMAYFPYERSAKQRMSVEVVDRRWLGQHWNEIRRALSRIENSRLVSFLHLKQAIEGKSSPWSASKQGNAYIKKHLRKVGGGKLFSPEVEAHAVISLSEPVQKFMDAVAAEYAAGGFQSAPPGGRIFAWKGAIPEYAPPTGPADKTIVWKDTEPPEQAASDFMFSLGREPRALEAAELTLGLSRLKPCVWLDQKEQRQFGLFCPDLFSAIYAVATVGFGIAACLRCGELFLRGRADNQFCSPRCQNTYLTAKRRRREKRRASKRRQRGA